MDAAEMIGEVVTWIEERGFGFIRPDSGGTDLFVHRFEFPRGTTIRVGMRVEYTPAVVSHKLRAVSVRPL